MTDTGELDHLISLAKAAGAVVVVTYDKRALECEGRRVYESVQVTGLKGVGPLPMGPVGAAEALRSAVHQALYGPKATLKRRTARD